MSTNMWFDLKGDQRLGRCATEGCGGQPTFRLEAEGVGSNFCSGCRREVDLLRRRFVHHTRQNGPLTLEQARDLSKRMDGDNGVQR